MNNSEVFLQAVSNIFKAFFHILEGVVLLNAGKSFLYGFRTVLLHVTPHTFRQFYSCEKFILELESLCISAGTIDTFQLTTLLSNPAYVRHVAIEI